MRTITLSDRKIVLYDINDLKKKLGVSKPMILGWLQSGKLAGEKIGRAWMVSEEDLLAFLVKVKSKEETPPDKSS